MLPALKKAPLLLLLGLILVLAACTPTPATSTINTPAQSTNTPESAQPTKNPSSTRVTATESNENNPGVPTPTAYHTPTPTPDLRLRPELWQNWPIIPDLSPQMAEVYQLGKDLGRDPQVFSVIGDCQSSPTYFLSIYDEGRYTLPEGQEALEETITWYASSYAHRSITVKNGMTAPGALNPRWAEPELCESNETPVECEIRLSNPSLMLISLGTNWNPASTQEEYIAYLTQIVETLLENGVIPVLSTKADNVEGDYSRNLAMAQVAFDYHLPLWNFWAAVKDLPNMGLDDSREDVYLNYRGWDVRNYSALVLLDHLRTQLADIEE